jgi:DcmR-like sensory protein
MTPDPLTHDRLDIKPGYHICALYMGSRERDTVLLPFVKDGLTHGDKCVCIVDSTPPADLLANLGDRGEIEHPVASHQLEVKTARGVPAVGPLLERRDDGVLGGLGRVRHVGRRLPVLPGRRRNVLGTA